MSQLHPIQNEQTMFVTTNIRDREHLFENDVYAREAIETLYRVQQIHPFFLYGFVIMPNHCHLLLRVPTPGSISKIINVWKGCTSMNIGLGPIWQPRFHMKIPNDSQATLRYIHLNPVRADLVEASEDYPWSSASGKWDVTDLGYW